MKHTILITCCIFSLAFLCVGSGVAMMLTDDYQGTWARFLALAVPLANLCSVYALAALYVAHFYRKGPRLGIIDYLVLLGILVLWTSIILPTFGSYKKLETRRAPPVEMEFIDSRDQPESRDSP